MVILDIAAKECQALLEDRQQKMPIDVLIVRWPHHFSGNY